MSRTVRSLGESPANASRVFHYEIGRAYPTAVGGDRCWVHDSEGNRWLDAGGGAGAVTLGYGIPEIAEAIARQANELSFAYSRSFTTLPQEQLADLVLEIAPRGMGLCYFVSGGSEANESAIKFARLYFLECGKPEKYKILSRWPSYHGNTLATLSLSGRPSWSAPFSPMLQRATQAPVPYPLHWSEGDGNSERYGAMCAQALEDLIVREGPESVAAVIAEPIVGGTSPAVTPPPNYWRSVREICDRHDVLLVLDEVLTGFGRTGRAFGIDHWGVTPDLITCAKGISSGYAPLGAVIISDRVADAFRTGSGTLRHSFTYSGHALSCAAGVAAVRYLVENDLIARADEQGRELLHTAKRLLEHDEVAEVRGVGLLIGIEFAEESETSTTRPAERIADRVVSFARSERVILTPAANGDQLQLLPPFTTQRDEWMTIVDVIDRGLRSLH